jgi:hypothetical protein
VSRILILEDHHDTGLGHDVATRWLADKGPEGVICSGRYNTASGVRYRDSSQGVRNTGQPHARVTRFALSSQNET